MAEWLGSLTLLFCPPTISFLRKEYPSVAFDMYGWMIWSGGFWLSSVAKSWPTLCDPMDCSMPGIPVHHQLLEPTQTYVHHVGRCRPTISSFVVPFSSCLQSFPASESFPVSRFFASGGQSIRVSASVEVLSRDNFKRSWNERYWVGLSVHSGFFVSCYEKFQTNFLPTQYIWKKLGPEVIVVKGEW